jgi:hypothetical protein
MGMGRGVAMRWCGLAVLLALAPTAAGAAELRATGDVSIGGDSYDQLSAIDVMADGTVAAVGSTFIAGGIYQKGWVVKVASDGTIVWETVYLDHFRSKIRAVAAMPGGDVLIAGSYWQDNASPSLAFVARLDEKGTTRWAKAYGGHGNDETFGIATTGDGGAVVVGFTVLDDQAPEPKPVGWAFRIDTEGTRLWEATFDTEPVLSAAVLVDGDIAVAGSVRAEGDAPDLWAARLAPDGAIRWQKSFGGGDHDSGAAVAATSDNGFIVAGETLSQGAGGSDAWLIKVGAAGEVQWARTYGGKTTERFSSVDVFDHGAIVAVGTSQKPGTDDFDLWIVLADAGGKPVAGGTLGGNRDDRALGVAVAGDNAMVVAGIAQPADSKKLIANGRILFLDIR